MIHEMGRKFHSHHILRQRDPWEVARNAFGIALEFAVLGYVEEATELYNLFDNFASGCKASWSPGLYFAWEATGLWPDSIPQEERTPKALSRLETERILWKRQTNATDEGLEKLIKAGSGEGKVDAWGESQIRADDLTAAIDVAVFLNKTAKAKEILQIFADHLHVTLTDLSKSRQVWSILREKQLSRAIGVDGTRFLTFKKEVFSTFKQRLEKGAKRVFKNLTMQELVHMCNENTLKNAVWEEMEVDPEDAPETILHKGATKEEIAALEKRLGHDLPIDYREFLMSTNGLGSLWNGFYGLPKFHGTEDVHIFDATEQQESWNTASVDIMFVTNMSVKPEWPILDRVIQVNDGAEDTTFVWLMEPEYGAKFGASFFGAIDQLPQEERAHVARILEQIKVRDESDEGSRAVGWQVVEWCPGTLSLATYDSFREYFELIAGDTANEDILDEQDEQGRLLHSEHVFAYQLR